MNHQTILIEFQNRLTFINCINCKYKHFEKKLCNIHYSIHEFIAWLLGNI